MACSRCGAPLEFANGHPVTCHFCGETNVPDHVAAEPAPHDDATRGYGGHGYGGVAETPHPPRSDFEPELFETQSIAQPPPAVPTGSGSIVGKIILVAAIVLGAVVVLSIVSSSGSGERHHPHQHEHHHGR